jgi:hypothetical protein
MVICLSKRFFLPCGNPAQLVVHMSGSAASNGTSSLTSSHRELPACLKIPGIFINILFPPTVIATLLQPINDSLGGSNHPAFKPQLRLSTSPPFKTSLTCRDHLSVSPLLSFPHPALRSGTTTAWLDNDTTSGLRL